MGPVLTCVFPPSFRFACWSALFCCLRASMRASISACGMIFWVARPPFRISWACTVQCKPAVEVMGVCESEQVAAVWGQVA